MHPTDEHTIPRSRTAFIGPLLGLAVFIALAVSVALLAGSRGEWMPAGMLLISAGVLAVFFAIAARQFLETAPGLVLNSEGITDNSSGLPCGFVPWSDVLGGTVLSNATGAQFIVLAVSDPAAYSRRGSAATRWLRNGNARMLGSPVWISVGALAADGDEVVRLVLEYVERYTGLREEPGVEQAHQPDAQ